MKQKLFALLLALAVVLSTSSCVPLAVGAAAGYVAHEEGYRLQSPVKRNYRY